MSTLDVISAGIVIADCVARPVESLPPSGQLALIDSIGLYLGGSAANTAATLSKLGLRCAVVGRVGQDGFGDFLENAIQSAGCDTRFLRRDGAATSATVVHVDAEGERTFLHAVGANANLKAADVPLDSLAAEGARALHVAGYYVLPELEPELPALLDRASRLGLLTSLDTVWNASGAWERLHACLPYTDVFCPSLHDARLMTGKQDPKEVMDRLFGLGVRRAVVLKMGPEGSLNGGVDGTRLHISAAPVQAVDGTGAGDAFIGGFLAALLRGEDLESAGRLGNAAGALCALALGAVGGLQDMAVTRALANTLRAQTV